MIFSLSSVAIWDLSFALFNDEVDSYVDASARAKFWISGEPLRFNASKYFTAFAQYRGRSHLH